MSESEVQAKLRLAAAKRGAALWRNNSGACRDETGRLIRYGLGNDSAKLNAVWKSSDLIGITPVRITPDMIGRAIGVFTAVEVKREDWVWRATPREKAQNQFLKDVARRGGIGLFANCENDYIEGAW